MAPPRLIDQAVELIAWLAVTARYTHRGGGSPGSSLRPLSRRSLFGQGAIGVQLVIELDRVPASHITNRSMARKPFPDLAHQCPMTEAVRRWEKVNAVPQELGTLAVD